MTINLKHNWTFDLGLTNGSADHTECYTCSECHRWTANKNDDSFCDARDRRRGQRRKYGDRRKNAPSASRP